MSFPKRLVVFAAVVLSTVALRAASPEEVEQRVDALLNQMTLEEKVSLLGGDKDGFSLVAIPRLGIPKLVMSDGPQGVRNYGQACMFPSGVVLAATWDTELAQRYGQAMGLESRARGVHILLGPGVNISRLPVNGRSFEYFGEDPFLTGKIVAPWITGMQNEGVIATVKHFAANNQETDRSDVDVRMDDRTLYEIYLPAFRSAVEEGHVWAVMCAYNRFRENYCGGSDYLQNQILKGEWGFRGLEMSDWGATHRTTDLKNGLDLEMASSIYFDQNHIKEALERKRIEVRDIENAVRRTLRAAISMGFLDREQKRPELPLDSPDSAKVALDVARAGLVLLKNDNATLPLDRQKIKRIAVYGPNAVNTPSVGGGSGGVSAFHTVDFLNGIRALSGSGIEVVYVGNPEPTREEIERPFPMLQGKFKVNGWVRDPEKTTELPDQDTATLTWKGDELPGGIDAPWVDYFITGTLMPEEDGLWEVFCNRNVEVTINGTSRWMTTGNAIQVKKGQPLSVKFRYHGIRKSNDKDRTFHDWLTIRKLQLPDLSEAKKADVVVVCVGLKAAWDGEGADRAFDLPEPQGMLIRALAEVNPRTIVTINSGAAVGITDWIDRVPAVFQAWYLGQEGGTALGEALFGDINPSGRLPSTFGRRFEDWTSSQNFPGGKENGYPFPIVYYKEGIFVGYRDFDHTGTAPLFPFGHGLSYTSFDYSDLAIEPGYHSATVTLKVKNSGQRAGAEIVQLYIGQPGCSILRPVRELKGFSKVALQPGETQTVTFKLPPEAFSFWHPHRREWTLEPGLFNIEIGQSSRDIVLKGTVEQK